MKLLELLTLMAKGKVVPSRIEYKNCIYKWDDKEKDYHNDFDYLVGFLDTRYLIEWFDDEIKIIEENNKIEKLRFTGDGQADYVSVIPKINELIDEVNRLKASGK